MKLFLSILLGLLLLVAYLFYRYLRIRFGLKDSNYGGVQHSLQAQVPISSEELFLPGSRANAEDAVIKIAKVLEEGMEVKVYRNFKRERLFRNKDDIKRALIVDKLLDRPKW